MKLKDFYNHPGLNTLRNKMGAPMVYWSFYGKDWRGINPEEWKTLITTGIDIDITEIEIDEEGLFTYKKNKVLVYIRDQYFTNPERLPEYKVHICQCKTLDTMRSQGRYQSRYVVTMRHDGVFLVNLLPRGPAWRNNSQRQENVLAEMKVCKNCLSKTRYKGYPSNRESIYQGFSFKEYLDINETDFIELPSNSPETMPLNQYSENQVLLSRLIRANGNYICERCGDDYSTAKHLLDLHHVDGAKNNNTRNNLQVLCVRCHAKQPKHSHMRGSQRYVEGVLHHGSK